MAMLQTGFTNINTGKVFPMEELGPIQREYMEKNPDQFCRNFVPNPADAPVTAAGTGGNAGESTFTKEGLEAMDLKTLKAMCKERELVIGDLNKDGVIDLILADQDERDQDKA